MKNIQSLFILVCLAVIRTHAQIINLDSSCGKSVSFEDKLELGASPTKEGQAGWQVLIKENSKFKCGGSLISSKWIITAASCVYRNLNPSSYLINLGVYNMSDSQFTIRSVSKIIIHPAYDPVGMKYDIALIKMADPVDFWLSNKENFNIIPICVSDGTENYVNKTAIATGYASYTSEYIQSSDIKNKQTIKLRVLEDYECKKYHTDSTNHDININTFIEVCAKEIVERPDKCGMDRGGPLAVLGNNGRFHLVGITSWGYRPCFTGGVFTRISTFADYIINVINTN